MVGKPFPPRRVLSIFVILLIAFLLFAPTIPWARANQPLSLTFAIPMSVFKGYQGQGFYFTYNLTNNLESQERLTNLTVSLDYGSIQPCPYTTLGPQDCSGSLIPLSPGNNIGYFWIQIPMLEPTGNHTFYATANFQYLDNSTDSWVTPSDSPQIVTGTLIVLPSPASTAFTNVIVPVMLPVAGVVAIPGILLGAFSTRRARNSLRKDGGLPNILPRRNDTLLPLAATIFFSVAIIAFDSLFSQVISAFWVGGNILGFLLLMGSVVALYGRSNYSKGSVPAVLFLSFSATVASTLHTGTIKLASSCFNGTVGAGFPLPWAPIPYPLASYSPIDSFCFPPPIQPIISLTLVAFVLDATFYFAVGLCLIEIYRIVSRRRREKGAYAPLLC